MEPVTAMTEEGLEHLILFVCLLSHGSTIHSMVRV